MDTCQQYRLKDTCRQQYRMKGACRQPCLTDACQLAASATFTAIAIAALLADYLAGRRALAAAATTAAVHPSNSSSSGGAGGGESIRQHLGGGNSRQHLGDGNNRQHLSGGNSGFSDGGGSGISDGGGGAFVPPELLGSGDAALLTVLQLVRPTRVAEVGGPGSPAGSQGGRRVVGWSG